ncbi:hypothetical protein GU243_24175 (plasmid) [Pseudarthrobacter psychrotolerans]|uniref:Histidine kinase n=1 Tax=Pseudarthrobacter psychrotolerans TaxID=2697569 RepID=A0A6P1NQG7_9MICC|nr:hypothetical protein [Pseudarthrobacter psychrotolerans]QHK22656.1 hypothetical protein GU243_24175 [Pseudarthrobacter psychrotolerans]
MKDAITRSLILAFGIPFPVVHILLGLANLGRITSPWPTLAGMTLCVVLMLVVTWSPGHRTLSQLNARLAVAGIVLMELSVMSVLPAGSHPGYAAWQNGAIEMLMVTVAIRNRITTAWIGIGIFAVIDLVGSLAHGLGTFDALALVATPLLWVGIATAVSMVLQRCDDQVRSYAAQRRASAADIAADEARQLARNEWTAELVHASRPMLDRIARAPLLDEDRDECRLIEALLRDRIRGRSLASPEVEQAARLARQRGVQVDILDNRGAELPDAVRQQAVQALTKVLLESRSGVVRVRALPAGSDVAVTILASTQDSPLPEFFLEIREPLPRVTLTGAP